MRRCRQCREYAIPKDAPRTQFVCGIPCSIAYGKAQIQKRIEKAKKAEKLNRVQKIKNFRLKDMTRQKDLTQAACNKLVSLLDKGLPCISCGRPDAGGRKRNASHFKSRGANSGLRFDLRNLHMSCVVCNLHMSGNVKGYEQGIVERYGQAMLDYLESAPRLKEWTIEELTAMRKEFAAESRRLERGERPSKNWRDYAVG